MYGWRPYRLLLGEISNMNSQNNLKKRSYKIALGGIVSSLCLLCMFLTGVFPVLMYGLPAIAGVLMIVIVIDVSKSWAYLTYFSVSILSLLICPDKEAAVMFIGFFGFYPILKSTLEKIKVRSVEYVCKFAVFNACILISYWVIINVFGIGDIIEEMGDFGDYGLLVMLLIANITFFVYDIALTRIISSYINWFRPNILRKR